MYPRHGFSRGPDPPALILYVPPRLYQGRASPFPHVVFVYTGFLCPAYYGLVRPLFLRTARHAVARSHQPAGCRFRFGAFGQYGGFDFCFISPLATGFSISRSGQQSRFLFSGYICFVRTWRGRALETVSSFCPDTPNRSHALLEPDMTLNEPREGNGLIPLAVSKLGWSSNLSFPGPS